MKLRAFSILLGLSLIALPVGAAPLTAKLRATAPSATPSTDPTKPYFGLALVQIAPDDLGTAWSQLRDLGVTPIKYVPDNVLVVRARGQSLETIDAFPLVVACDFLNPAFKMDPRLTEQRDEDRVRVTALAHLGCSDTEIEEAGDCFDALDSLLESRLGTILTGSLSWDDVDALCEHDAILWIEPAPNHQLLDEVSTEIVAGSDGSRGDLAAIHQLGYQGENVVVAVADSGLDLGTFESVHPDLDGRVDAFFAYGLPTAADGHSHGTHVAGIVAAAPNTGQTDGDGYAYGLGVAPQAHIVVQRIFDSEGGYTLDDDFERLVKDAIDAGAEIGSNSWGDNVQGIYDISAARFDALVRDADPNTPGDQPYILEFSAGNSGAGLQTINSPAVAKNVIATGASQSERGESFIYLDGPESMADFSSRGPAQDGRIKPDLVAPGTWIASLQSAGAPDSNAWQPINQFYQFQGGTSQSGPHVSGGAAIFVDYYRRNIAPSTPSPALVKAALIHSTIDLDDSFGTAPIPNFDEGWGRMDLTQIIEPSIDFRFLDQTEPLIDSVTYEERILIANPDVPLRITLAYTDVPGNPGAIPALVNDLDLEVIGPGGVLFAGNQFSNGQAIANPSARDPLNNVECVILHTPEPGEYTVRVHASRIVEDALQDTPEIDQDFALVVSGGIQRPGEGLLIFDRPAYTAPADIQLRLIDEDLAGEATVTVTLQSESEPLGESITLEATDATGTFAANLTTTATGPAMQDGALWITDGDTITVTYNDLDPAQQRTATAAADLMPPSVNNVSIENQFGKIRIDFTTDERARATVNYGIEAGPLNATETNANFRQTHRFFLDELIQDESYQFVLVLEDQAGNRIELTNANVPFVFVGPSAPTALLVDSFYNDISLLGLIEFPAPPLANYTDTLDQIGVSYDVWNVLENGTPTLSDLKPFRVVLWRFPEPATTPPPFLTEEQQVITDYLNEDGSLFIASMDLLSRVDDSSFARDTLQVNAFSPDVGYEVTDGVPGVREFEDLNLNLDFRDYDPFGDFFGGGSNLGAVLLSDSLPSPTESPGARPNGFDFSFAFNWSDSFVTTTNAVAILQTRDDVPRPTALRYPADGVEEPGRLIFMGFPVDALPVNGPHPNNRAEFMRRAMEFLAPGAEGVGQLALDRPRYTIPSRMEIDVADSDLVGSGAVTVQVQSSSAPEPLMISLAETARPGEFRGALTLSPNPNPGELAVLEGDTIEVHYQDESNQTTISQTAPTDVDAPEISNVQILADYAGATIQWTTTEPSDSLIEFGESQFFTRSASSGEFEEQHSIRLSGLRTIQNYTFQITSRDEAGNATVDDNGGQFYIFQTLSPETLPWNDSLSRREEGWSVIDRQEFIPPEVFSFITGVTAWEYGLPNNPLSSGLASGSRVWASNLLGAVTEGADSMLVTPAFQLSSGFAHTLSFRHRYDFSIPPSAELYEVTGELYVTLDDGITFEEIRGFTGRSNGWELASIELPDYGDALVRFGFYFGFIDAFNYENVLQPGWLISEVSLESEVSGSATVRSNLYRTGARLEGAATREGSGELIVFEGLPEGAYTATFDPVPYYQTPAPLSFQLTAGSPVDLEIQYTIVDTNQNQIPDSWETEFFGSVTASHPPSLDSDQDGASDYTEFIAGTDPTDPIDRFALFMPVALENNDLQLLWSSDPTRPYRLEGTSNLLEWSPLTDWTPGRAGSTTTEARTPIDGNSTLYRVRTRP